MKHKQPRKQPYLRVEPPDPEKALPLLERALKVQETVQAHVPSGLNLDRSKTLEAMGEGLCYQRLRLVATSAEEKRTLFERSDALLRKALTRNATPPGYAPMLPYRALATLYYDAADYPGALRFLKQAQQLDPVASRTNGLDRVFQDCRGIVREEVGKAY